MGRNDGYGEDEGVVHMSPCLRGYMFLEMDSLTVGAVLWGEFCATVKMWPLTSSCPSCGFCFDLKEGFLVSDGKNTFVGRMLFMHQGIQGYVGNYFPDASKGWQETHHWEHQCDIIRVANSPHSLGEGTRKHGHAHWSRSQGL